MVTVRGHSVDSRTGDRVVPAPMRVREVELLLRCGTTKPDPDAIERLVDSAVNWQRLLALGQQHRVMPLLRRSLFSCGSAYIPDAIRERLDDEYRRNAARNLLLLAELTRVLTEFEKRNIPVIPFKGPATALIAYRELSLRQFGDVDLLVRQCDYARARELLRSLGMLQAADWGWESSHVSHKTRVCVDLHKSITGPDFPVCFDFDRLYRRLMGTHDGTIRTLSEEDTLILLCVQVAKDSFANRLILAKVCDIGALLENRPNLSWSYLEHEARRLGCRRIVGTGIRLARVLLGTRCHRAEEWAPGDAAVVASISEYIDHGIFRALDAGKQVTVSERRFYFMTRERWRDRLAPGAHRWAVRVLRPNEKDRAFVRLPGFPDCIYYLVRPLRLLRDYAVAGLHILTPRR